MVEVGGDLGAADLGLGDLGVLKAVSSGAVRDLESGKKSKLLSCGLFGADITWLPR